LGKARHIKEAEESPAGHTLRPLSIVRNLYLIFKNLLLEIKIGQVIISYYKRLSVYSEAVKSYAAGAGSRI
jgi:hypothetical protein